MDSECERLISANIYVPNFKYFVLEVVPLIYKEKYFSSHEIFYNH
jgi:hypothetical protein